jgi:predicted TIM-barrel fold metal-dependent hydrolase
MTKELIIDAHTHWGREVGGTTPFTGTFEDMISDMDKNKIDMAITFPMGMSWDYTELNEAILQASRKYSNRIIGFARINPHRKHLAIQDIDHFIGEKGLKGVKLHPTMQAFFADDPAVYPIMEKAAEMGFPVYIHSGGGSYARPSIIVKLAKQFPKVTVIVAHVGYFEDYHEALAFSKDADNLILDCTGQYLLNVLRGAVNLMGAERIINGSDWPYFSRHLEIKKWDEIKITDKEKKLILGENAKRIFNIHLPK